MNLNADIGVEGAIRLTFAVMQKGEPMKDTIYRQDAIDAIAEMGFRKTSTVKAILCRLETLPSAQPLSAWGGNPLNIDVPSAQRTGRWRSYPIAEDCWQCSECGVLRMGDQSNYCPNCGAKMEVE